MKDEARKGGWSNTVGSIECQTEEVCTSQYVHFIKLAFKNFKQYRNIEDRIINSHVLPLSLREKNNTPRI